MCAFFFFFFEDLEVQKSELTTQLKMQQDLIDRFDTVFEIDAKLQELEDRLKDIVASDARIKESVVRAATRTTDSE